MRRLLSVIAFTLMVQPLMANDQFNQGMAQGKKNKDQAGHSMQALKPGEVIPGYTASPQESSAWGGVKSGVTDLSGAASQAMSQSEAGQTIYTTIQNTPADSKPSMDAPFIAEGLAMKDKAEALTSGAFNGCVDKPATFTEITTHQCLRDTKIERGCTRTATMTGTWQDSTEVKTFSLTRFTYSRSGKAILLHVAIPEAGTVRSASLSVRTKNYLLNSRVTFMNTTFNMTTSSTATYALTGAAGMKLAENQVVTGTSCSGNGSCLGSVDDNIYGWMQSGDTAFTLKIVMEVRTHIWHPSVAWNESCSFNKAEGRYVSSVCVQPGETRTVIKEGKPYSLYQACWQWKDTYMIQAATEGTCGEYIHDSACSVSSTRCADTVDGVCVSEEQTWSCERRRATTGQLCGGEFFCKDGSCAQAQTGTSNMFGQAVSALAAVASAGKDVAALNGENVRAFTGQAKSCKKFAAGFNNCCQDSGWGQDVGLSSCSSDEKALGKAKSKKLTIYVGEYCSKKVLGVCLEKKRGYCVFESKLARIVQEQGRRGQLGIGFGSGSSPDCRGITVDELQRLRFDVMNFSDFYSDLNANSNIPQDQALLKKAQEIVSQKLKEAGQ